MFKFCIYLKVLLFFFNTLFQDLQEKVQRKDELLREYELDLARLRQAEFIIQKKSDQLDDIQVLERLPNFKTQKKTDFLYTYSMYLGLVKNQRRRNRVS